MIGPLKAFWTKIPAEDRKLIRWTILACIGILLASLIGLFAYASSGMDSEPTTPLSTDSLPASDSTSFSDTTPPPPPSPLESHALLDPGLLTLTHDETSSELDSLDASAHRELMRLAASQYHYTRALTHAKRIAPLLANDPEFQAEMGHLFLESGSPNEALPHLALALIPQSNPSIESDLSLAMFRAHMPDSALSVLHESLKRHPNHPQLLTTQAALMGEWPDTTQRSKAQSLFTQLVQKHPHYAEARYQYSRYLMAQGNMKSAWVQIQKAQTLDPLNPRILARLGMVHFYLNQDALAEKHYRTALAINPYDYNTWFNLGELYLSQANEATRAPIVQNKTQAALESYLAALALNPSLGSAHFRTGMILNGNAQHREAIQHLQAALQQDPHSVRILLQLSTAWEQLGDLSQAMNYLEQAHAVDPFHKVVANHWLRIKKQLRSEPAQGSL